MRIADTGVEVRDAFPPRSVAAGIVEDVGPGACGRAGARLLNVGARRQHHVAVVEPHQAVQGHERGASRVDEAPERLARARAARAGERGFQGAAHVCAPRHVEARSGLRHGLHQGLRVPGVTVAEQLRDRHLLSLLRSALGAVGQALEALEAKCAVQVVEAGAEIQGAARKVAAGADAAVARGAAAGGG